MPPLVPTTSCSRLCRQREGGLLRTLMPRVPFLSSSDQHRGIREAIPSTLRDPQPELGTAQQQQDPHLKMSAPPRSQTTWRLHETLLELP